jgi:predicted RNA-binding Zn-ribbon protein involved in translation (DUF1610 family)
MPAPEKKVPQDHKEKKAPITNQVQTLVSIEQQRMVLACPKCGQQQLNVGVKFCSNCAHPLIWENIVVVQPPKPQDEPSPEPIPAADAKPVN